MMAQAELTQLEQVFENLKRQELYARNIADVFSLNIGMNVWKVSCNSREEKVVSFEGKVQEAIVKDTEINGHLVNVGVLLVKSDIDSDCNMLKEKFYSILSYEQDDSMQSLTVNYINGTKEEYYFSKEPTNLTMHLQKEYI